MLLDHGMHQILTNAFSQAFVKKKIKSTVVPSHFRTAFVSDFTSEVALAGSVSKLNFNLDYTHLLKANCNRL